MKPKFVDCFMLMNTALSLKNGQKLPESEPPFIEDVFTTYINLSLTVQEFRFTDVKNMEFEVTALLNQHWIDPRLGANERTRMMAVKGQIWRPKILNVNGQNIICNQDDSVFWRGFGNEGNVLLSEKYILQSTCTKYFQKFPFDTQICEIKFGTYRFPIEEVELRWNTVSNELFTSDDFIHFKLVNIQTYSFVEVRPTGNFSISAVQFIIKRNSFHYVICIVIPSMFLILLSYTTFLFGSNQCKTRLNVNIFCFCIFLALFFTATCIHQPVPYFKLLDIFLLINVSFVFTSIIETLFLEVYCENEENNDEGDDDDDDDEFHCSKNSLNKEILKITDYIENGIKIFYPILYCLCLFILYLMSK